MQIKQLNYHGIYQLLRDSISESMDGAIVSRGAALSFYTLFAIAPLFVIVLAIAGVWFREVVDQRLGDRFR